ncbi:MAG: fasciclin domain-containing protein [Yoonia sp.]|nr:fasciclin domain-containing protein [Yoonia sp.]
MINLKTFASATAVMLTLGGAANAGGHSQTIVDIAAGDERFSTLVAAVTAAGLVETLSGEGPFTVFAPLNDAFAALPEGTVETLLMEENMGQLTDILTYHVVSGAVMSTDLAAGSSLVGTVMADSSICITSDMGVTIADGTDEIATVVIADIEASNGVIHVIDKVLLPGTAPVCE